MTEEEKRWQELEKEFGAEATSAADEKKFQKLQAEFDPPSLTEKVIAAPADLARLGMAYGQGRTFGAGPKVMSAVATPFGKVGTEIVEAGSELGVPFFPENYEAPTIGQTYKDIYGGWQDRVEQSREEHPFMTPALEIGGEIKTGLGLGRSGLGKKVTSWAGAKAPEGAKLGERAFNLFKRSAKQAALGETAYKTYEVGTADVGKEMEALTGTPYGLIGGAGPIVSDIAGTALPKIEDAYKHTAKLAEKHGIPVSMTQVAQTRPLKAIQKVSQDLPFSGADEFRDRQLKAWNRALSKTFGQDFDSFTTLNMRRAFEDLGDQFSAMGKGKTFDPTDTLNEAIERSQKYRSAYGDEAFDVFEREIDKLMSAVDDTGKISGDVLNNMRIDIGKVSRKATKNNNFANAEALRDVENVIVDIMTGGDNASKTAYKTLKYQYKNLLAVEPLTQKGKGGNFSPTLLSNRIGRMYGRQYTTGAAGDIGELAQIGQELIEEGGSDTFTKAIYGAGITAGAAAEPTVLTGLLGNRAYQKWFNQNQSLLQKMTEDMYKQQLLNPAIGTGALIGAATEE